MLHPLRPTAASLAAFTAARFGGASLQRTTTLPWRAATWILSLTLAGSVVVAPTRLLAAEGDSLSAVGGGTAVTQTTRIGRVLPDTITETPTLTAPASVSRVKNPIAVAFTIPENALSGSLTLTFTHITNSALTYTLILADSMLGAATRGFSFDPANPTGAVEIVSGPAIPDGTYNVKLSYRDQAGNAPATAETSSVTLDTVAPSVAQMFIQPRFAKTGSQITLAVFGNETLKSIQGTIGGSSVSTTTTTNGGALNLLVPSDLAEGTVTFSVTVTDVAGNESQAATSTTDSSSCIVDRTPPQITVPQDITVEAAGPDGTAVTYASTVQDTFDPSPNVVINTPSGFPFPLGTTQVNFSASDAAGNSSTASFKVTVRDTIAPTGSAPAFIQVPAGPNGVATLGDLTGSITAQDTVGVATILQDPAAGAELPLGLHPVSFTIKDAAGNSVTVGSTLNVTFVRPNDPEKTAGKTAGPVVAKVATGDLIPGGTALPPTATLGAFASPAISERRQLAARATILDGKAKLGAIYTQQGDGTGALFAYQGLAARDMTGFQTDYRYLSFLDPVTAPNGAVAFVATVAAPGGPKYTAICTDLFTRGTPLYLVLQTGSMPGLANGEALKKILSLSLRDDGLVALVQLFSGTGPGSKVTAANDTALVVFTDASDAKLLLRKGTELPIVPGSTIKSFSVLQPAQASAGHGRWHGTNSVLARVTLGDGSVRLVSIAYDGTVTPLLSSAEAPSQAITGFDAQARWKSFSLPVMGCDGREFAVQATLVAKAGSVTKNDDTALLFSPDGAAWEIFARKGDLTPISALADGPRYASFFDPVANDAGQLAFLATLQGKGVTAKDKTALFCGDTAHLRLAARLNAPAPDESGTATTAVWSKLLSYALPSGDGADVVLIAETSGGDTTGANKLGVWGADSVTGKVRRLLRAGVPLVNGGKTVKSFSLLTSLPGSFGAARSYNETGSLAVLATFADKTQALVRVDIP